MVVAIRAATAEDTSRVTFLIRSAFHEVAVRFGLTPENCPTHPSNCEEHWITSALEKGVRFYILEEDGTPCGCVALEVANTENFYLERLSVLPEHRKKGFGRLLVAHVLEEAKAMGAQRVKIALIAEDKDLRDWYEKRGFIANKTARYDHLPFEVLFMHKDI